MESSPSPNVAGCSDYQTALRRLKLLEEHRGLGGSGSFPFVFEWNRCSIIRTSETLLIVGGGEEKVALMRDNEVLPVAFHRAQSRSSRKSIGGIPVFRSRAFEFRMTTMQARSIGWVLQTYLMMLILCASAQAQYGGPCGGGCAPLQPACNSGCNSDCGNDSFGPYFSGASMVPYRHRVNQYGCVRDSGVCGAYRPAADVANGLSALAQPCRDFGNGMTNLFARSTGDCFEVGTQCGPSGYRARAYGIASARQCSGCGQCGGSVYWPAPLTACMPSRSFNPYSPLSCPPDRSRLFTGNTMREFYNPVSDVHVLPSLRCDNGYEGPHADRRGVVDPRYSQPQEGSILEGPSESMPQNAPSQVLPHGDQSARIPVPAHYSSRRTAR